MLKPVEQSLPNKHAIVLGIAEDIIKVLPLRLQGKYFHLRTAILTSENDAAIQSILERQNVRGSRASSPGAAKQRDTQLCCYIQTDNMVFDKFADVHPDTSEKVVQTDSTFTITDEHIGPLAKQLESLRTKVSDLAYGIEALSSQDGQHSSFSRGKETVLGKKRSSSLSAPSRSLRKHEYINSTSGMARAGSSYQHNASISPDVSVTSFSGYANAAGSSSMLAGDSLALYDLLNRCVHRVKEIHSSVDEITGTYEQHLRKRTSTVTTSKLAKTAIETLTGENSKMTTLLQERDAKIADLSSSLEGLVQMSRQVSQARKGHEEKIDNLERIVLLLKEKVIRSDRICTGMSEEYTASLSELRAQTTRQIEYLGSQLAVTYDRMRRFKKMVEEQSTCDLSGLSSSVLTSSFA